MDNSQINLFNYAYNQGIICLDKPFSSFISNIENESILSFSIDNKEYNYDFKIGDKNILDIIHERLPITVIIDLLDEAIHLGIINDISEDYKKRCLLDYNKDYIEITKEDCFYFTINSESFDDTIYKITFDKKKHDIKNKIEYASRTSLFVDTLIKRIMAKYNILLVKRASWNDTRIPTLPLDDTLEFIHIDISDSTVETDKIENQLKVLINYRDNFNNTTCTENIIDDIFINLSGKDINYGFFNIMQSNDDENINYDLINEDVSIDDIDSLLRIRNIITSSEVKFNIFETLRKNESSNLAKLLDSRIKEYDSNINSDPKIEFSITPLSIYCNHIVEKTSTFKLKSKNKLYSSYEVDYDVSYNPLNVLNCDFIIYGDGDSEILKKDDKLVLAFTDIISGCPSAKVTSKKYASMLYKTSKRYDNEIYKDIYFLNESLVKIIDNNLCEFDGVVDSNTYLRNQVVKGEISGKYLPIDEAIKIERKDILGIDILDDENDRYIAKEYARYCDICHHTFGATKEIWELYRGNHKIVNDPNSLCCCDNCKGSVLDNGMAIIYSSGYKEYYYDDPKKLLNTEVCINCNSDSNSFIYVNSANRERRCKICKRYYCNAHINQATGICVNCSSDVGTSALSNQKLLKLVKKSLDPIDMLSKDLRFNYIKDYNSLWVYSKKKTYYILVSEDEKFIHLVTKNVKRGEK